MEPDQPPSTPSINPNHPLHDNPTPQGSRPDEHLLDPSAPTSMCPEIFQGNSVPEIGTFSTSIDVHSYSSAIPHIDMHYHPLGFDTPPQLNQSHPLGLLPQYPSVWQAPTIYPLLATSNSLNNWQQSTSLPQGNLGPHPQPQEWSDLALVHSFLHPSTSSGPPPEAATASLHRESVDESEPQAPNLPPM